MDLEMPYTFFLVVMDEAPWSIIRFTVPPGVVSYIFYAISICTFYLFVILLTHMVKAV